MDSPPPELDEVLAKVDVLLTYDMVEYAFGFLYIGSVITREGITDFRNKARHDMVRLFVETLRSTSAKRAAVYVNGSKTPRVLHPRTVQQLRDPAFNVEDAILGVGR